MLSTEHLKRVLKKINGRDYGSYQSLKGTYDFGNFIFTIDRIPKDPYAPSFTGIYRVVLGADFSFIPPDLKVNKTRKIAYSDFLARRFFKVSNHLSQKRGTGNSGLITIDKPGQAILNRNSVLVMNENLEVRFFIGLPAEGRIIKGSLAETMLLTELPSLIEDVFQESNIDKQKCEEHLKTAETAEWIRLSLKKHKLISFIADNSLLPRKSGTIDEPLSAEKAILFKSPASRKIRLDLPDGTSISGMGIPEGIILIVGGGYHGKSTLLQAISSGVYNHIPGDGRELVLTRKNALKLRSYSGRFIEKVDISPFINNLPDKIDTKIFSSDNSSGSTSQAASLIEGLECGMDVILMDEDTCASNFMFRDKNMIKLVPSEDEPITPFIDRVRQLYSERDVSTLLVMGGSGDYFNIADLVIQMKNYLPLDVSAKALSIAEESGDKGKTNREQNLFKQKNRIPLPGSIIPENIHGKRSIYAKEIHRINFGMNVIDMTDMEQLLELSQTKAIMEALQVMMTLIDGKRTLVTILDMINEKIEKVGLDGLSDRLSGNLASFRMIELAGTLNRLRSLKVF